VRAEKEHPFIFSGVSINVIRVACETNEVRLNCCYVELNQLIVIFIYCHFSQVSPFTIPALLGNTASGVVGIECGCKGPNYGVTSACASASHAIGEAFGMIQDGFVDQMVAGGTEASITPLSDSAV
jgi:hypothetical protein